MRILGLLIVLMNGLFGLGQDQSPHIELGARLGLSVTGGAIRAIDQLTSVSEEQSTRVSVSPAFSVTADYFISPRFSCGILISSQRYKGEIFNYEFKNKDETLVKDNVEFDLRRRNFSIVPKFHYPLKSDRVDVYSGLRMGYLWWKKDINTLDKDFSLLDKVVISRFNFGVVPIGMTMNLVGGIGLNAEVAVAAPYILSGGVVYVFQ